MNILVIGSTGFIGKHLVEHLCEEGYSIYILVRESSDISSLFPYCKGIVRSNFTDNFYNALNNLNFGAVINLAWASPSGSNKGNGFVQIENIALHKYIISNLKHINYKQLICSGSIAEYSYLTNKKGGKDEFSGTNLYGKFKIEVYDLYKKYFINNHKRFYWLRLSCVISDEIYTFNNIFSYLMKGSINKVDCFFGPCVNYYNFISINSVVNAFASFIRNCSAIESGIYNVTSSLTMKLYDFIMCVGKKFDASQHLFIGKREDDGTIFVKDDFFNKTTINKIGVYEKDDFYSIIEKVYKNEVGQKN